MLASLYRRSQSGRPPLRIGLLLDSVELPSCFAEVVDHIQESNFAHLKLLIFNAEEQPTAESRPKRTAAGKLIALLRDPQRRRAILYSLYQRWDQRNVDPLLDPHAPVDCSARLQDVEAISVSPIRKRFVHRFPPEAIERIREKELDVLIRFGFNILRGDILTAAKYGVWSYHHGDGDRYRGGPAHFWELYENNPISGAMLQVLTEQLDAGKVLYKGLFATEPGISRARNCIQPYWGASTFMIQKLRELHERGWEHVERTALRPARYLGKKKIYTVPSNSEMVRWLGPIIIRKSLRRLARRPVIQHWRLAIRSGETSVINSGPVPDLKGFHWIESPRGCFYADPFLIEESGKSWVFFEDFDYSARRGRISCAEVRAGGIDQQRPVLERPYHLSYPSIFRDRDALYMIPETGSNGTVELYRCEAFPDKWKLERELLRVPAVDSTMWVDNSVYWLFVTIQDPRGFGLQLWLFCADTLDGEWTPHPACPLSTDVRNSRGGGAIFRQNGRLFRPSQDCSRNYGYSCALNEITVLDHCHYTETPVVTIDPVWAENLIGTHTYSHLGPVEVVDGCVPLPAGSVSDSF